MDDKFIKLALDAGLLNYVDHETPRHYFINGHADLEDVAKFAELVILETRQEAANEIERLRGDVDRMASLAIDNARDMLRLREALKEIADAHISGISGDVENIRYGLIKRYTILVDKARAALKEGE